MDAQSISLNLQRVEKITYRARQPREQDVGTTQREPIHEPTDF